MKQKLLTLFLVLAASIGITNAAIVNGTCGDNLAWSLNTRDSTLTIEGSGEMTTRPWSEYAAYIAHVNLNEGLTSIISYAFQNCINLMSVSIPGTVSSIYWGAFAECTKLTSVFLGEGIVNIDGCVFSGCIHLKTVTIPKSLSSIGVSAFKTNYDSNYMPTQYSIRNVYYNGSLEDWCLKSWGTDNVAYIYSLFINDISVTDLIIPNDIISSLGRQFRGCTSLISVTIPEDLTRINDEAFANCSNLNSIFISNSVTDIGKYAFVNCNSLTEMTIGYGIINIGENAFTNCNNITSLTIGASNPPSGGANCGINATNCTLYVPATAIETYANSVWWEDFKEIIAIPAQNSMVTFKDWDGTVLSSEEVEEGSAAIAPTDPTREGYTFIGWDQDFSNITESLIVTAQYKINRYSVQFLDWDNSVLKADSVDWNTAAIAPADPTREGYDFVGWDKTFDHVTENMIVSATYEEGQSMQYHLTFVNNDDEIFDQVITVKVPAAPIIPGFTFVNWQIAEKDFVDSIIVEAIYSYNGDATSAPSVAVNPANSAQKLIREGNVYILRGNATYSTAGMKVE